MIDLSQDGASLRNFERRRTRPGGAKVPPLADVFSKKNNIFNNLYF
jgi:hypothetical protein